MSPGTFLSCSCRCSSCVGWILIATQPGNGWQEGRLDSWSDSIGILGVVHSIGLWHGVLAFGLGLVLGLSLDGVPAPEIEEAPAYAGHAGRRQPGAPADEPVAAERRYDGRREPATRRDSHRGDRDADADPDTVSLTATNRSAAASNE